MSHPHRITALAGLVAGFLVVQAAAQPALQPGNARTEVYAELGRAGYEGDVNADADTGVLFVGARHPVSDRINLHAEIAWSRFGFDFALPEGFREQGLPDDGVGGELAFTDLGASQTTFSNPYLGAEIHLGSTAAAQVGIWLPLIEDERDSSLGVIGGWPVNPSERFHAFVAETTTLVAVGTKWFHSPLTDLGLRLQAGPLLSLSHGDAAGEGRDDAELFARYGAALQAQRSWGLLSANLSGLALLSETELDDGDRALDEASFEAIVAAGSLVPRLRVSVPLDGDLSDLYGWSVGVGLGIGL